MPRQTRIRPGLFIFILVPIVLGVVGYLNLKTRGALASIQSVSGTDVALQPAGMPDHKTIGPRALVNNGDRLETGVNTTVVLEFTDGSQVKIEPESRVQVENDESLIPPETSLQVLIGQANVLRVGSGRLILVTDQHPREVGAVALKSAEPLGRNDQDEPAAPASASTTTSTTLSPSADSISDSPSPDVSSLPNEYIESIIRGQRSHLSRCFSELLRRNAQANGRIDISLTIESSGHTSHVHSLGSTISDTTFQQCIVSIFQQMQFKSFPGSSIIVNYPLQFR